MSYIFNNKQWRGTFSGSDAELFGVTNGRTSQGLCQGCTVVPDLSPLHCWPRMIVLLWVDWRQLKRHESSKSQKKVAASSNCSPFPHTILGCLGSRMSYLGFKPKDTGSLSSVPAPLAGGEPLPGQCRMRMGARRISWFICCLFPSCPHTLHRSTLFPA